MTPLLFLFFALALGGSAHSSAAPRGDNEQQANQATRARDFFVSPDGSDSHDGSRAHPWKSITHAAKMASPGATVHVLPGIYDEVVVTEASGNSQDRIKYVSQLKWKAVISPAAHGIMAWKNTGDYTDVDGFDIAGSDCNGIALGGSRQRAIGNNVHNTAAGCDNSSGGAGINDYSFTSSDNDIVGNYVHDVGTVDPLCGHQGHRTIQGIYQSNSGGHIMNNVVIHNCVYGIHLWHAASHATIVNNTVAYNLGGGILIGTGDAPCNTGGCPGGDDYTIVENNIVAFNGNPELRGWGISESSGDVGPHNQYIHNLSYRNASGDYALNHHLTCDGCIEGKDPEFVDSSGGDFHLKKSSPARGAGAKSGAAPMDFLNTTRTRNVVDVGAYESDAGSR